MPSAPVEHTTGWNQGQGCSWMQPARHGQCCPHVLPSLEMDIDSPGGHLPCKCLHGQEPGGGEKGEEMKREAEGEEEQEEGRRREREKERTQGSSRLQHPPNSLLVKGHLWDSGHKPGWFGQAQPRPTGRILHVLNACFTNPTTCSPR